MNRRPVRCALSMALALAAAACGDSTDPGDGEPLTIGAVFPADGATGVPVGSAVTITFLNQADPASLERAVTIASGGLAVPVRVTYDEAQRIATVSAPLLPATSYLVRLDTTARADGGERLEGSRDWTFGTAAWHSSVADAVETFGNTGWGGPALTRTADGRRHLLYGSFRSVHYASCGTACDQAGAWSPVDLGMNDGLEPSVAVDGAGGLHLLSGQQGDDLTLWYAACASGCGVAGNWTLTLLEQAVGVVRSSLRIGPDGMLHAAGYRATSGDLLYGHCAADCTAGTNWTFLAVAESGTVGQEPSLAIDGEGGVHIAYLDFTARHLGYATCSASCEAKGNWTSTAVNPEAGAARYPSIAAGPDGSVGIAYYDETARDLRFALCREGCTASSAWLATTIEAGPDVGRDPSLAIDQHGRAHIAHYDFGNGALRYATCAAVCESSGSWRTIEADGDGDTGRQPALWVGNGRVSIAYMDYTAGNPFGLKVIE